MKGFNRGEFTEKSKNSKYGIVYTTWNTEIVSDLLEEACKELIEQGVDSKNIITKEVPGAFELPLAAKLLSKDCSTVIALGAIIRGDTPHFDYISSACVQGLQSTALETEVPIICGVLTTDNDEQALERSDPNRMNKGKEFAQTAMNTVDCLT